MSHDALPSPLPARPRLFSGASLTAHFLVVLLGLLIATFLALSVLLIVRQVRAELRGLERHAAERAAFAGAVSPEAVLMRDFLRLETLMRHTANDPDVLYAVIVATDGRALTRYLNNDIPQVAAARQRAPTADTLAVVAAIRAAAVVREVRRPIVSEGLTLGEVWLGYSTAPVRAALLRWVLFALGGAALLSLVLAAPTVVLFRRLVRDPLSALGGLAQDLAGGDLSLRAPVGRSDEIGRLQEAFNAMAERLQSVLGGLSAANHSAAQANAALTEQRDFALQVLNTMGQGLTIVGADGRFTYVNPAYAAMLGYAPEALIGSTPVEFTVESDRATLLQAGAGRREGESNSYETRLRRADGDTVHALITGVPRVVQGRIEGSIAVITDLTRQKQAEEALRVSEREALKLSQVASRTDNLVIIADAHGYVEWVNAAFTRVTGFTLEEMIGRRPGRMLQGPDTDPETVAYMGERLRRQEAFSCEVLNYTKSGTPYWVAVEVQPVHDDQGRVTNFIALEADITERRRFEEVLRESEGRLRHVLASALDAVIGIDGRGVVSYWNQQAAATFGWSVEEALGRRLSDLIIPHHMRGAHDSGMERYHETGHGPVLNKRIEVDALHRDGRLFPVELAITPVKVGDDESFSAFVRDISERKASETALRQAKEAAEAADRAKSQFLANMSHEIRTPMNAVIGLSGLLLHTALSAEQRDYVDTIRTSGEGLLTILNDILDFSKIEAGHMELDPAPFEVHQLVEEVLDLFAVPAGRKRLDLAYWIGEETPAVVEADAARLRQVLVNLVSNAVKFTDSGEVTVTVHSTPVDARQHRLEFTVRDSGIGIPADRLDQLFRPFRQLDASTTRKYGGTGLGLVISRRLAELMGGSIAITSNMGEGTRATFQAVVNVVDLPVAEMSIPVRSAAGRRALVVDDNATNCQIVAHHLRLWGMGVEIAPSAEHALRLLAADNAFDVAILDVHMPGMDGPTLAAHLHAQPATAALPLIYLSSTGRAELYESALSDAVAYLHKPLKPGQLRNVLLDLFGRSAESPAAAPADALSTDGSPAERHPLRILLAEDNLVNQKVTLLMLQRLGYRATVVANGLAVLEALEQEAYDVILMDIQMPEMDGVTAAREVTRRWPQSQRPRIIALTAHALEGDREFYLAAGMQDYVSKPTRLEELAAALERTRPLPGAAATLPTPLDPPAPPQAAAGQPVLDRSVLAEQFGSAADELLAELLPIFLADTMPLVAKLRTAVQENEATALWQAAHAVKGAGATLGLRAVADCARSLEQLGRRGELSGAGEGVEQLAALLEQVKGLL